MIARPCAGCGDIIPSGSRCPACRPGRADTPPRSHVAYANHARWKNHSKRLRRASPFCEQCGSVEALTVDHVIPVDYDELIYADENCRVLCKGCNGRRQDNYTRDEALTVLARLQQSYRRRPTTPEPAATASPPPNKPSLTWGDTPNVPTLRRAARRREQ